MQYLVKQCEYPVKQCVKQCDHYQSLVIDSDHIAYHIALQGTVQGARRRHIKPGKLRQIMSADL